MYAFPENDVTVQSQIMASHPSRKESLRPPDCNNESKIRLQGVTSSQ